MGDSIQREANLRNDEEILDATLNSLDVQQAEMRSPTLTL